VCEVLSCLLFLPGSLCRPCLSDLSKSDNLRTTFAGCAQTCCQGNGGRAPKWFVICGLCYNESKHTDTGGHPVSLSAAALCILHLLILASI